MKNLKFVLITLFSIIMLGVSGQEVKKQQLVIPLSNPDKPGYLDLGGINCSIFVTGYNGKEVIVDVSSKGSVTNITETKSGLKKINASSMSVEAEEHDNRVDISSGLSNEGVTFDVKVPFNFSMELSTVNNGEIKVENINGEISVNNVNGPITMNKISGSVSASSVSDDITINFDKVNPEAPMAFSSVSGKIDITFPSNLKANLKLKNQHGEILTDFDVDLVKERKVNNETDKKGVYKVSIDEWIQGKINGGGAEYTFKNFSGNIIIRKK